MFGGGNYLVGFFLEFCVLFRFIYNEATACSLSIVCVDCIQVQACGAVTIMTEQLPIVDVVVPLGLPPLLLRLVHDTQVHVLHSHLQCEEDHQFVIRL